jgi:diaminohydroxyphosphoribosylaminopyrimidine deaminase/5-amino-6-(5-phosphoribosylamino)uracil reductase
MNNDEKYMQRCFELALKGTGYASPNPLVGSVIVKNGKIVAEGYHKKYGTNHGERAAIVSALKKGINLKGAELYVNLEPCAHFGKTPPCAELIVEHKFSKVVIGVKDPYHKVAGKGIKILKKAGIKVITGVLENEAIALNKFFFKYVKTGLPYIMLKAAQTLDGKIADDKYRSKWISSEESRRTVHKLRSIYDAVLVGANTVKHDDPQLNVRSVKGRDPYRIIIDKDLSLGLNYKVFKNNKDKKTIVLTSANTSYLKIKKYVTGSVNVIPCRTKNGIIDLKDGMKKLAKFGIASIMVEGGAATYDSFLKQKTVDEVIIFIAPKVMGKGITAFNDKNAFKIFKDHSYYQSGCDILVNLKK